MIVLTELAAKKIQQQIIKRGKGLGIKIGVKPTGCSGLTYILEFIDEQKNEKEFEMHDVKIYIEEQSLIFLNGMIIDWKKQGLNEGFEFENPNERARCGCGISFTV